MCEFCAKHGDGKKWYLQAKNYSEDLTADLRRQKTIAHWFDCYRCGVCRAGCSAGAISLQERSQVPIVARDW